MTVQTDTAANATSNENKVEYRLGILLLAAGASRRFNGIKQLARLQDENAQQLSMLQLALQKVALLPAVKRIVTLGANQAPILSSIHLPDSIHAQTVENWQEGIAASIRCGVAALQQETLSHIFILLADQPALTITDYNQLIALSCNNLQNIICAHYGQKNAVPAIFPASCFSLLSALEGDKGAGKALNGNQLSQDIISVDLLSGELDIDTQSDLMKFQHKTI